MAVAARRLPAGAVIASADIKFKSAGIEAPSGAFSSRERVLGRITSKSFAPGETLFETDLRDPAEVGIAAHVPVGQRAFSLRVAEDEIVGGFLQSGDHVDIFATIPGSVFSAMDAQVLGDRSQALLLLQNVQVLAVGENPATRGSIQAGARTVSLALAPKDLARLSLALRYGKVSLAIRKPGDMAMSDGATATLDDLVRRPVADQPVAAPRARPAGIPFYSGTHVALAARGTVP